MLKFNNINIGITSKCNAKCKFCNRTTLPSFKDINAEMPIETFKKIYKYSKHIDFCGSFGDFINHSDPMPFLELAKNYGTTFTAETNAGIRDDEFWKKLGKICNSEDYHVQFSIDEIEKDINPYRKNLTKNVLRNLNTFIEAGGYAVVKTLLFEFNEEQIEHQTEYFNKIGIKRILKQYSMMYDDLLKAPSECKYQEGTLPYIASFPPLKIKECPWRKSNWAYILDNGEVHPCCNLNIFAWDINDQFPNHSVNLGTHKERVKKYTQELLNIYIKNKKLINLNTEGVTLELAWNNEYNDYVRNNIKQIPRCSKKCGYVKFFSDSITGVK